MSALIILAISSVILSVYFWIKRRFQFWERRRVPHLKPKSLIFGNNYDMIWGKSSMAEHTLKQYRDLSPHKFGGVYNFQKPVLYVRDPDLIKSVLIKDFHHFSDRSFDFARKEVPLSRHLFNLYGEEWKILRHKLSPTFTSGKMKILFALVKECAESMREILDKKASNHDVVQVKDLMGRYTTDVISSCAFGLEADSLNNPDSEFRRQGRLVFTPTLRLRLVAALIAICPSVVRFLHLEVFPKTLNDFFMHLVRDTIEYRKQNGIVRNDFLNLLMNVQEEGNIMEDEKLDFSMELLTAQCFVFFAAGFETSSNILSFILYELAEHPDVQRRLHEEVDHVLQKHNGQITYDSLQEMHYMDQVFNETSRLFPALPVLFRVCTQDYHFPESDLVMKRGDSLFIPVYGIHRDPQYYPNPDVFNPENFSDEAKASRPSCCFLSFGDGPRNCIGMRFGIMQVKLALTIIMREYTVAVSSEMKLPIEIIPYSFVVTSKNEILLNFEKRNTSDST